LIRRSFAAAFLGVCLAAAAIDACAADLRKVVRYAMKSAESKLDPQSESDEASGSINESIFDSLLQYDYLARPAKLRPRTAATLPEVNADGTVYVLKVKPGIFFTPDPAFQGKPRELTAADYAYSLRRLMDPKLKSQWLFLVEGKIKGADAVMADARKTNRYDYDRPIEGLRALDRYTLRIELNNSDFGFANVLAIQPTSAVAREVAELYGDDIAAHPVGTGPYLVKSWTRGSKLVLEANPGYREEFFEGDPGDDARSREIHARLKGQRIPIVGRIEIYVIDEDQPRWLAFLNGEHDYIRPVPEDFAQLALPGGKVAPNLQKKGITATPDEIAYTTYTTFNMQTEIDGKRNDVGGYTPERVALRRAIAMSYRIDDQIALLDKNQSRRAYSPLPPAVAGHDPVFVSPTLEYNPAKAKALLDMFGFIDRDGDGYRENPDGLAPGVRPRVVPAPARTPAQPALEELHGRDRHPRHVRQRGEAPGAAQAGARWQGAVVQLRLDRGLSGRREFPPAHVEGLHRPGELRDVRPARVQRAVRARQAHARRPGAQRALREDGEAHLRLRAVDGGDLQAGDDPDAALAPQLPQAPVRPRAVALSRHRHRPATKN
jgi:ABC-type transport system substrate-binding protein